MRIKHIGFCLLITFSSLLNACGKAEDSELKYEHIINTDGSQTRVEKPTIDASIKGGAEISILPSEWMDYYNDLSDYENIKYYYMAGVENTKPRIPTTRWTGEEGSYLYEILLSTNKMMENPVVYETCDNYLKLVDLYAGTHYYYQIKAKFADKIVLSKRFDFKTVDFFRTLDIDGVLNARDLGNKKTADGKKRIKQGLVYRCASFDSVTALGKGQALENYGIKTDLDLREQGPTSSPLGPDVNYVNNGVGIYGSPMYVSYDTGVNADEYHETMKKNLLMFANMDNLPLAFHCAVGRDRTGTLAITLELLLGIDLEQVKQDYVVTFFSKVCETASFNSLNTQMNGLIGYYNFYDNDDWTNSKSLYSSVEKYCMDIGLTKADINSIRNNLLEDVPKE